MLGSHAPRPRATPKNATKQIIAGDDPAGDSARKMTPNGSLWVSLAASVLRLSIGGGRMPIRCSRSSARCPWPCVASQRGDFGSEKRSTKIDQREMPTTVQMPRQWIDVAEIEHEQRADRPGQAPPMNCINGDDAAANSLGRVFRGVGEAQRLLGAEADPGDEPEDAASQVRLGANAPAIVATPNSKRLNW